MTRGDCGYLHREFDFHFALANGSCFGASTEDWKQGSRDGSARDSVRRLQGAGHGPFILACGVVVENGSLLFMIGGALLICEAESFGQ